MTELEDEIEKEVQAEMASILSKSIGYALLSTAIWFGVGLLLFSPVEVALGTVAIMWFIESVSTRLEYYSP